MSMLMMLVLNVESAAVYTGVWSQVTKEVVVMNAADHLHFSVT